MSRALEGVGSKAWVEVPVGRDRVAFTALSGLLFVSMLVWAGVQESLHPVDPPPGTPAEERLRVTERLYAEQGGLWDGSWARRHEVRLSARSPLRREATHYWALARYFLFGEAPPAIQGPDGWLHLRDDLAPSRARDPERPAVLAARFAAVARRLQAFGTETIVMPVPRKGYYAPAPPGWTRDLGLLDRLLAALADRGVTTLDLRPAWEVEGPPLYQRTDSHWSFAGARLAAEAVARELGLCLPPEARRGALIPVEWERREEIARELGLPGVPEDLVVPFEGGDLLQSAGMILVRTHRARGIETLLQRRVEIGLGGMTLLRIPVRLPIPHLWLPLGVRHETPPPPLALHSGSSYGTSSWYSEYLAYYSGERVRDLPQVGKGPDEVCGVALAELGLLPEAAPGLAVDRFLWEMPIYQLFRDHDALARVGDLLSVVGPDRGWPSAAGAMPELAGELRSWRGRHELGTAVVEIGRGRLLQPGGGQVLVQLEGHADGPLTLILRSGEEPSEFALSPGRFRRTLALIGPRPADVFRLEARAQSRSPVRLHVSAVGPCWDVAVDRGARFSRSEEALLPPPGWEPTRFGVLCLRATAGEGRLRVLDETGAAVLVVSLAADGRAWPCTAVIALDGPGGRIARIATPDGLEVEAIAYPQARHERPTPAGRR